MTGAGDETPSAITSERGGFLRGRAPLSPRRRLRIQRVAGARYDELHAFLVRVLHPIGFAGILAFPWLLSALDEPSEWRLAPGASPLEGIAFGAGMSAFVLVFWIARTEGAVIEGFRFVYGPWLAALGALTLFVLGGAMVDSGPFSEQLLWTILTLATSSVVMQVLLLLQELPSRWRDGLLHVTAPAAAGLALASFLVGRAGHALYTGHSGQAENLVGGTSIVTAIVLLAFGVFRAFVRLGDRGVLADFATRHGLDALSWSEAKLPGATLAGRLAPEFGAATKRWWGEVDGRYVDLVTGCTKTRAPDLPSLHLTVLAIGLERSGPPLWIRRRAWGRDNVLASAGHTEVVHFESIALDERFDVRVPTGTPDEETFGTFGPQLVLLLAEGLGAAQLCRLDDVLLLYTVGGVVSADELDEQLRLGFAVAGLLEGAPSRPSPSR
ncbi:MAG: hypothetical protein JWM98_1116 [Thermoleophilia bacterium]|nr:hypothetical protein [Thermoleophilia bacterium]